MKLTRVVTFWGVILVVASLAVVATEAQRGNKVKNPYKITTARIDGSTIGYHHPLPRVDAAISTNWTFHNLDLAQSRYVALDQINTSNVRSLAPRWIFQTGVTVRGFHSTPLVVNGVMYVTDGQGSVYAMDAATGDRIFKFDVSNLIPGGEFGITNRGVVYGDGVLYVAAGPGVFAIDAKTGEPLESFGPNGESEALLQVLQQRFPDVEAPIELGYAFTQAPQFYNGMVFVGATLSERHIPGGMFLALDAKTGQLIWSFNIVPQGPEDEGWEIAGPTWVGGVRNGGGNWETAAIDPDLGTLYLAGANPSPDLDGSGRVGRNLFTNSIIALDVNTGKLKFFFQQVHHDIWDYDSASSPILFDFQKNGRLVKAVAQANKNGFVYILDRQTGQPVNPILEVPVSTLSDVPGEEPYPTQPIPFTANGRPMEPFVPLYPTDVPPELASQVIPTLTPVSSQRLSIQAPGTLGGANFAPMAFSPRTSLLYVAGIDAPVQIDAMPVGATLVPGQSSLLGTLNLSVRPARGYVTAYDPATGELVFKSAVGGMTQAGVVVTEGDLLFVGDFNGYFYALDAKTGEVLMKFQTGSGIAASPMVYELNGEEFVSVASGGSGFASAFGDAVVTFALPRQ